MLERDMENLIAAFPEEFFPGHSLVLRGRQQAFAGIGRFDLLFTDRYETSVLMELKAVTAKYENATQLAKYRDALEAQGKRNILMWLVAPHIPNSVREFLDRIGIEYSEIHEAHLRRVAERHGTTIEPLQEPAPPQIRRAEHAHGRTGLAKVSPDSCRMLAHIDQQKVANLINEFEGAVKRRIDRSLAFKLRKQLLDASPPSLDHGTILQLARWCKTENPLYWDGMAVAQKISMAVFGEVLDREQLGT
jgi:hypothetical protein